MLELNLIRIDGGTQSRAELNQETVAEYAEAYRTGASFPPVIVFFDGTSRWLADGFHRYFGAKKAGLEQIYEEVIPGTQRDAVLYSLKANATHGLKRTNADKRKAVETLLADAEWATWSDNKIAQAAGVNDKTVSTVRKAIFGNSEDAPTTRIVERNGKTYEQDTSNIGKGDKARPRHTPKKVPAGKLFDAQVKLAKVSSVAAVAEEKATSLEQEISVVREQLTEANDDIASMSKALDAGDPLAVALADAKSARDLARGLQQRINSMLTEIAELNRSVKFWKKKAGQEA